MKAQKLTSIAISTAFISAALTSPAVANDPTVLPFNANGTNNSGISIQACQDTFQVRLPMTMANDPQPGNLYETLAIEAQPYERFYNSQVWTLTAPSTSVLSGSETLSGSGTYNMDLFYFAQQQTPGDTFDLVLSTEGTLNDGTSNVTHGASNVTFEDIPVLSTSSLQGTGTDADPYLVSSVEELNIMRCDLDAHYKLTADIDMADFDWIPIGFVSTEAFTGVLDGNGKTISNFSITQASQTASLLGYATNSVVFDLTFDSPVVHGFWEVGVLAAVAEASIFENISIVDMQLTGLDQVGGLTAKTNKGTIIRNVSVSGAVNVPLTYTREGHIYDAAAWNEGPKQSTVDKIGMLVGYLTGDGDTMVDIEVDGNLTIAPAINGSASEQAIDAPHNIAATGLVVGENDNYSGIHTGTVKGSVNISFRDGNVEQVSGVYGETEKGSTTTDITVDTDVTITALKRGGSVPSTIENIGLMAGLNDGDNNFYNNTLNGKITIESGDQSRDSSNVSVLKVGALGGKFQENNAILIDSNLDIKSDFNVDQVGLQFGVFGGRGSVSNSIFKGQIDVPAGSTKVAGLGGFQSSFKLALRNVIVAADFVQGDFQSVISNTTADANAGSASGVFFDSDLNNADPGEFTSGPAGRAATTEQLKSKSFLEANGYDFENDWLEVSGEYPTPIKPVTSSSSTSPAPSFASAPSPAAVVVNAVGNAELGSNGGVITITGKSLTGVRLSLGETPLFVQLLSDTEALVQIPAGLAPGSYDLTATGANGVLTSQDVFTITDLTTTSDTGFWTTRNGDNVKIYAKNIIGSGKVQFFVNGEEIAWVNATDNSDEKLRVINEGPMAGNVYLVRDKDLLDGKNVFEIYVDGERVERRVASK